MFRGGGLSYESCAAVGRGSLGQRAFSDCAEGYTPTI